MESQVLVLLIAVLVLTIFGMLLLATLLFLMSRNQTSLLLSMIQELRLSNQSLLNQVRTQDPYTLLSLNAATQLSTSDNLVDEGYISHSDAAEAARFPVGLGDELTQDDIAAFGEAYFPQEEGLIR